MFAQLAGCRNGREFGDSGREKLTVGVELMPQHCGMSKTQLRITLNFRNLINISFKIVLEKML